MVNKIVKVTYFFNKISMYLKLKSYIKQILEFVA